MSWKKNVELNNFSCNGSIPLTDTLHRDSRDRSGPWAPCQASKILLDGRGPLTDDEAALQMERFFEDYYADTENSTPVQEQHVRVSEVLVSLELTGGYEHTINELSWATKTAWRNAPRCVGRDIWKTLRVADERSAVTCREIFEATCKNLRMAYNGGKINPSATVFRQRYRKDKDKPGIRVWNKVLLGFAGFVKDNGEVIGDPQNVYIANLALSLGWLPKREKFELLPLIITDIHQNTELFEFPDDIKGYIVDISHPTEPEITKLGLKWYAIPSVSSMMLEAGGIQYTCCQIAGFFQDTEVSIMNLLAESRYNLLEPIGRALKLDVSKNSTYWKCTVATELTKAVYDSFTLAHVSMTDHLTLAENFQSFMKEEIRTRGGCPADWIWNVSMTDHLTLAENFQSFMKEEIRTRGGCPADWIWVVPPMSSGMVPTFHQEMLRYSLSPSYEYQPHARMYFRQNCKKVSFRILAKTIMYFLAMMKKCLNERKRVTIVYATEGGTALKLSRVAEALFVRAFNVTVLPITEITEEDALRIHIDCSNVVIIVSSTYGCGGAPSMGENFRQSLLNKTYCFDGINYAVFGLGSSKCKQWTLAFDFGKLIDSEIEKGGGKRFSEIGYGDDQTDQNLAFETWIKDLYRKCCTEYLPSSIQALGVVSKERTFDYLYRWRYCNKRSLNECFQGIVGPLKKVFEFTIKDKIKLPSGKNYLLVLSYNSDDESALFRPGDHLGIFPTNLSSKKDEVIRRFHDIPFRGIPLVLEEKIAVHKSWREWNVNFSGLTFDELLSNVTDLNSIPLGLERLLETVTVENGDSKNRLSKTNTTKIDCAHFIGEMPTINRRLYSVASLQNKDHTVNILVGMQEFGKAGLTTDFVKHAPIGEKIQGYFISSKEQMRLPQDDNLPLLLVSAGSGFAPFMSFIEFRERAVRAGAKTGPIFIFHGCRFKEQNFLNELLKKASTVLTIKTFRAYSRTEPVQSEVGRFRTICHEIFASNPGPTTVSVKKGYVQDLIKKEGEVVARVVRDGGYIYVCGGTNMAIGVRRQLESTLEEWRSVPLGELIINKRYQEEKFS
ncbi:nitric oxide synthase, inducible-like [Bolinopsis microptera]|uniref:nitric oxide synthase, inducible-like n=1 Tax=Bolinopsis microptera TaxID=2820187 RepID=UPI003078DBBA